MPHSFLRHGGGGQPVRRHLHASGLDKNGIDHHHPIGVSPDGLWSVEGVECLANCGFGPNMMVNDLLYEKVTPEVLEEVIAKYQTA